jgi:hypothetical protein
MTIHRSRLLASVCLLASLWGYGCDDDKGWKDDRFGRLRPSPIAFRPFGQSAVNSTDFFSRGVTLQRASVTPERIGGAACPVAPFFAPFSIVATGDGLADLFVKEVQMRFVDRVGVFGGSMTIGHPQLVQRFGSTGLPSVGSRLFPFSFPLGCSGQPAGTLSVVVLSGDSFGREIRTPLSLLVH